MGSGCLVRNCAQRRWSLNSRRLGTVRQQTSLGTAFHSELLMLANAFVLCVRAIAEVSRAVHVTSGIVHDSFSGSAAASIGLLVNTRF